MAVSHYVMALRTVLRSKHRGNDGCDGPIERNEALLEINVAGELKSLRNSRKMNGGGKQAARRSEALISLEDRGGGTPDLALPADACLERRVERADSVGRDCGAGSHRPAWQTGGPC